MIVKTGQAWSGLFVTTDATKAITASTGAPVGTLYVDGVANAAVVTITGSNPYKWAVTLPTLTAGQTVSMYITAMVSAVNQAFVTAEAIADTKRISDTAAEVWDYSSGTGAPDSYGGIVDSLTEESGGVYRFTAFSLGRLSITSSTFASGAITADAIAANAITSSELADGAITSAKFASGAITAAAIDTDAIGAAELAADAVAEIWAYSSRTLTEGATTTSDATASGAITRKRGNSWSISLTLGAITGYTSLWFTIKSSYDDADTASIIQIKKNASGSGDGLLYINGTTASDATKGSITVSDATTGAVVVALDETIADDLTPGTYYYDCQALISGAVTTPDAGTFTITADVTRSVT